MNALENIAIIGAGLIGRSWAIVFARAGHRVTVWDSDAAAVQTARVAIEDALGELERFGLLDDEPRLVLEHIRQASTLDEAVAGAEYIQESTAERVDVKRLVFAQMDATAAPGVHSGELDVHHSCIGDQRTPAWETSLPRGASGEPAAHRAARRSLARAVDGA